MMKANIALPPFHIAETTRFAVEADHELTQTLRRYQEFYKQAYGASVTEAELLREMARRFMSSDGEFQAFSNKRRRAKPNQLRSGKESNNEKLNFGNPGE